MSVLGTYIIYGKVDEATLNSEATVLS